MVTCSSCSRKLGCYASRGNGGIYYYYNCSNKYCTERVNVRKELMEKEFEDFIEQMKLPKSTFKSYQKLILNEWKARKKKDVKSIPQLQ